MAEDFTFSNLRAVVQAIAGYLLDEGQASRGVVVGYDRRFLSEHFAAASAEVLAGNGIPVLLTAEATPTPVTAFAVKQHETAGAVMLTASHNPPEYNGIKFIPHYAGPALPETTKAIEAGLHRVLQNGRVRRLNMGEAEAQGLVKRINPAGAYLDHLRQVVDMAAIRRAGLKVVVDPMFGAGSGYLETLLGEAGCQVEAIHHQRDPLFGGRLPEPNEANLPELVGRVRESGAHLGLALDGDADRFGIVDAGGVYLTANQVLVLALYHLLHRRGWQGRVVARTVATTHMLDRIAEEYGMDVQETAVGFKYIGQSLREKDTVLGGEESGGMSIRGHLPEKDGILAAALMAEAVAVAGTTLAGVMVEIAGRFGTLVSKRLDLHVSPEDKQRVLNYLAEYRPVKVAGVPVLERINVDGTKVVMADGSWALVRPSGTEPLFRLYAEAKDHARLALIQQDLRQDLGI
ncbi:phosphoglucomutase [Clostridiales bacterium PH28_bin88]|nr:phosphoglucomutase [Clostridiales bacterium PH28_bin88]